LEVAKALRKSASVGGPACAFRNNGTGFPLVAGVYNSRAKALIALEASEETVGQRILAGLSKRIPPIVTSNAPVHENIITGDAIDLGALPVPKYSPDDGGPYITPGIVVTKDPETGIPDIGHYRFEIIDRQTMSFNALPNHRFGKHIARARQMGRPTYTAAVVIGVDPLLAYTASIQVPDGTNDFEVAGGLRGAPVELVRCQTIDLDVPAHAEFVIEFEADFTKEVMEGPLGEYTGYYTPSALQPIARVTAITHRNGAYFQGLLTGVPPNENHILKQLPFAASFLAMMRQQFATIEKIAIPSSGGLVPHRHGDAAALRRRGAQRAAGGDRQQPPAQDRDRRRSRHRRAQFRPGRMGDRLPHAARARRDRGRRSSGRTARSVGRSRAADGPPDRLGDRHRRDLSVRRRDQEGGRFGESVRPGARRAWSRIHRGRRRAGLAGLRLSRIAHARLTGGGKEQGARDARIQAGAKRPRAGAPPADVECT
jgi:UbiD family decarboxylase